MEIQSIINLLPLVLLLVVVPKIWECCRILVWRPLMLSRKFKKQGISGPRYRLLYGNTREIRKMKIEANLSVLDPNTNDIFPRVFPHYQQWISQYGDTFLYWNGTEPTICISDPELAKQILSSKLGFSVIPKSTRPEILILFGKGLAFTEGLDWVRHKTILKPAFSIDRLKFMTKSMVDCTLRMFEEWRKQSKYEETEQNLMKMEMKKEFSRLTTDIAATTEFGSSYAQEIEIFRAQIEAPELFCCFSHQNVHPRKTVSMLNAATSEDSEKKMSKDEIIEECKTFLFSGHGLTSILLTWTTMLLSLHQDWQEKLREEVFKECGKEKISDSDTFSKLKLMNMVLMESLRLYGPVIKMYREATQDMKVGHVEIPKGTSIILPCLNMHSDRAVWGDDADKFNPLRFENGVSQAANHPNALLAFSIGPRTCTGQNFALIEAKTVLTMILQRFRISLSGEYKHAPLDNISLQPQHGLPVMFQPLQN